MTKTSGLDTRLTSRRCHKFPEGTKRSTIAKDLCSKGDVKNSWAYIYIECCALGEVLHDVKEIVEQAMSSYPEGTKRSTIAIENFNHNGVFIRRGQSL
jgi:hypothetical protein